jgi:hypothetical protein
LISKNSLPNPSSVPRKSDSLDISTVYLTLTSPLVARQWIIAFPSPGSFFVAFSEWPTFGRNQELSPMAIVTPTLLAQ